MPVNYLILLIAPHWCLFASYNEFVHKVNRYYKLQDATSNVILVVTKVEITRWNMAIGKPLYHEWVPIVFSRIESFQFC